jgi:hypothetical protein
MNVTGKSRRRREVLPLLQMVLGAAQDAAP